MAGTRRAMSATIASETNVRPSMESWAMKASQSYTQIVDGRFRSSGSIRVSSSTNLTARLILSTVAAAID